MATVFVTGGNGFLGRAVVHALVRAGHSARALARSTAHLDKLPAAGVQVFRGDLGDPKSFSEALRGCDAVVHCAAATGPGRTWEECRRINVEGTQNVLDAAIANGIKRFVNVSTAGVYGVAPGTYGEDVDVRQVALDDAYCATKRDAEVLCMRRATAGDIEVCTIRPTFVIGEGDSGFLPMFISMLKKGRLPLLRKGTSSAPLIDVDDVAELAVVCTRHPAAAGEAFNASGVESISWRAFATRVAEHYALPPPALFPPMWLVVAIATFFDALTTIGLLRYPAPLRRFDVAFLANERIYPTTKAETRLGFRVRYGVDEILRRALPHYQP